MVADFAPAGADSVAVAAGSQAPAEGGGDEDGMGPRRYLQAAAARLAAARLAAARLAAQLRARARSMRSSHLCLQLNLEVASGRLPTNN
jgi:hypothetical protein